MGWWWGGGGGVHPGNRISAIEIATAITQKDANNAARDVAAVRDRHPEVSLNMSGAQVLDENHPLRLAILAD